MNDPLHDTPADRIRLRPVVNGDTDLLFEIYASSRAFELSLLPWSEEQKIAFLRQQLAAQTAYYEAEFSDAEHQIILFDGKPAGRIYVDRKDGVVSILDINVLPEYRKNGICTSLISDLMREACPISIYVETFNPSRHLFTRLGFAIESDDGVNLRMVWRPVAD